MNDLVDIDSLDCSASLFHFLGVGQQDPQACGGNVVHVGKVNDQGFGVLQFIRQRLFKVVGRIRVKTSFGDDGQFFCVS